MGEHALNSTFEPALDTSRRTVIGLLACWLLLLALAALRPLALPDEGRYTEISRWMLVSGDWLAPRLDGLPFFHKPPLLHWLQAAFMAVLGVHPWVARLVPVLAAGLMLGGLYFAARRMVGETLARRAAWIFACSPGFLLAGQYSNHDMLVASLIAAAIWCFALSLQAGERPHAGWMRAGFVACALAVLTKGLIGFVLPGMVMGLWVVATRRWHQLPRLPWLSGLGLFVLVAAPWFVLAGWHYPDLWSYMFGNQQFTRFTGTGFNNQQPWWFYLASLVVLLFPWPLFALWRHKHGVESAADTMARQTLLLCWIWLVAVVVFFSIPSSKLVGYILPVMPPLALLAAAGWERAVADRQYALRLFLMLVTAILLALFVYSYFRNRQPLWFYPVLLLLALFPWSVFAYWQRGQGTEPAHNTLLKEIRLCLIWLAAIVAFLAIVYVFVAKSKMLVAILMALPALAVLLAAVGAARQYTARLFAAMVAAMLLFSSAVTVGYGWYQRRNIGSNGSNATVARELACRAAPGETVFVEGRFPYDLPFIAQTTQPLAVVQDWPQLRGNVCDKWQR
jgi:4-amino-4-deoxy-L-arabinose transferase-like glycosyltransferase